MEIKSNDHSQITEIQITQLYLQLIQMITAIIAVTALDPQMTTYSILEVLATKLSRPSKNSSQKVYFPILADLQTL
jgi:hypothetical protein